MRLGKRHLEVATKWLPSVIIYGGGSSLALVYFTDWKLIAANIPFYGGKFK
ncbi:ubiquinol-cytochrome c reductase 6.4 kDa subunit [Andrena cerasifolii]|uniref:ubiquinol-cytochrome c reductase 6.4 kDa subunit n=1 Tax=Andrena cerasifolii TaxID=2819439 RepID=UPI0040382F26